MSMDMENLHPLMLSLSKEVSIWLDKHAIIHIENKLYVAWSMMFLSKLQVRIFTIF